MFLIIISLPKIIAFLRQCHVIFIIVLFLLFNKYRTIYNRLYIELCQKSTIKHIAIIKIIIIDIISHKIIR